MRAPVVADTLGTGGVYVDPVWRIRVELSPLEQELLRAWWVRRLAFVAHAGAAVITTTQSSSRLEHSLGVFALTAHFLPDDRTARAAALLHDIGHLPFSHTFEHLDGLDHHALGADRVHELAPLLDRHGVDAIAMGSAWASGSTARRRHHRLGLDHLDSFVRSAVSHGRQEEPPPAVLARLRLDGDGVIDTDRQTADLLADAMVAEAWSQCSAPNVVAYAVLREVARRLLAGATAATRATLAAATDDEFWAVALDDERARPLAARLRRDPASWEARVIDLDAVVPPGSLVHRKDRVYAALPTVDGEPMSPDRLSDLPSTPSRFLVTDA